MKTAKVWLQIKYWLLNVLLCNYLKRTDSIYFPGSQESVCKPYQFMPSYFKPWEIIKTVVCLESILKY